MAKSGRQAALLRGINVGRAKRVAMADLRALVAGLGYTDVRTLLNSGNVVYTAPGVKPEKAAAAIEKALRERTGVSSRVTVLTAKEVAEIVADNPLADEADNPSRLMVTVLTDPADRTRLEPFAKQDWGDERLALGKRVAYQWCPEGIATSTLVEAVGRTLGDAATTRNWATLLKLHALLDAAE
ncbi:MAG TPA: DUF1697 domain-containing protein [Longimicrobium sp.]|nr:DUF1697 domain-containing protein [Longimicrobium sp.]